MSLTAVQGKELIVMARSTLEDFARRSKIAIPDRWENEYLNEKRGVFVTLKNPDGSLRGCIGFPFPTKPLGAATIEATLAAAAKDPRFPQVEPEEVPRLSVELSVLTPPEVVKVSKPIEYPKTVVPGMDGLIVSAGNRSGLLLPQVATEFGFGSEDFLSETCVKAGLMPDAWLSGKVVVQKFRAEIFSEQTVVEERRKEEAAKAAATTSNESL